MAYNPNQPRDEIGRWTDGQLNTFENAARKAAGLPMKSAKTYGDMKKMIRDFIETENALQDGPRYSFYGLRFEEANRNIGDSVNNSKHNRNREDERDFPLYGTKEYEDMEELNGSSSWAIDIDQYQEDWIDSFMGKYDTDDKSISMGGHAYIIAGNNENTHSDADPNEIVIENAVVLLKLY